MDNEKITIEATVNADLSKVWDYWILPEHIKNWNFASDDWHCPAATSDFKEGGKFSSTMASKDNSMQFDFEGIFKKISPKHEIEYDIVDGRKVNVVFKGLNNQTHIIESFEPESTNSKEMQKAGWQAILNNFKKYAEEKSH